MFNPWIFSRTPTMLKRSFAFSRSNLALAFSILLFSTSFISADESPGKFVPPDGKVLLITGQDEVAIDSYLEAVKIDSGGYAAYTSVQSAEGLTSPADNGGGVQYGDRIFKEHPNSVVQLALYMVRTSQAVISGDADSNLDHIGNWIKSIKRPVFFRIGYEFDLPENNYKPSEYVKAYRYIVDRFRKNGVTNVAYVWHSYAQPDRRNLEAWYPGDDYVDWFAVSLFDQKDFTNLNKMADLAEKHHKPLMIAESSPCKTKLNRDAKVWDKWFVPVLDYIEKRHVKAWSYINCNWDRYPLFRNMNWGDCRVQSNSAILKNWIGEISKDKYLKASPDLFKQLGYAEK